MGGEFFNAYPIDIYMNHVEINGKNRHISMVRIIYIISRWESTLCKKYTPLEPVVVINIDNTKVQIIIDIYKPHINYFIIIFVFILYEKVYSN